MGRRPLVGSLVSAVIAAGVLAAPAPADAHLRSGTVAVDYRARVVNANTPAYVAQIFQSDRALSVKVKPRHTIVLLGYLGEPVFRLDAAGLWVNAASPTAVVQRLVAKSDRAEGSTPQWRLTRGKRSVVWQDTRAQGLQPGVSHGRWSVPLIVDGRRSVLAGELRRYPPPVLWPWLGGLAALLAAGLAVPVLGRRDLAGRAASGFALAAMASSGLILVAFALDAYASPGTWIEALDSIAFLGVGAWVLFRGPERWRMAGAIGIGLVGLAVGLLEGAVFLHPIVLAVLPSVLIRLGCIVAIGAGLDAAALGGLFYADTGLPVSSADIERGMAGARMPR